LNYVTELVLDFALYNTMNIFPDVRCLKFCHGEAFGFGLNYLL